MTLNLFNRKKPHKIKSMNPTISLNKKGIASTIVTRKALLNKYDTSKLIKFINSKHVTIGKDEFILAIDAQGNLKLDTDIKNFFENNQKSTIILIGLANQAQLIQNPISNKTINDLTSLSKNQIDEIDNELTGIIHQIDNVFEYRINQDNDRFDFEFDYRVYPTVYNLIISKYDLSPNNKIEISDKIYAFVTKLQIAYLWLNISDLKTNIELNDHDVSYQQIQMANHLNNKMQDIHRIFIDPHTCVIIKY